MAYNNNKGPQHTGDIQFEGDPDDTQIDFENDNIKLKTGGLLRLETSNLHVSASGPVSASSFWGDFHGDGSAITGIPAGSVAAAGSTTQVQYNDGGAFAGSSNMTFNGTTLTVNGFASTGTTTLGNAGADTVTINATTVDIPNVAAGTDNTVVVYNGSTLLTDEIDSRVWGTSLVDKTGTPADNQISVFTDSDTIEGTNDLTYDGTRLDVVGHITASLGISGSYFMGDGSGLTGITAGGTPGGSNTQVQYNNGGAFAGSSNMTFNGTTLTVNGLASTGNTTLGNAGADTVTINAETIDIPNVAAGTDNTVVVYNGSTLLTDEIDSRVWGTSLVDKTGSPADSQIAVFTDADTIEGAGTLTYDGTKLDVTGHITASLGISGSYFMGDGSGLTGITATATPGGSNTQVQYNNGGSFAGSSNMVFNGTTLTVNGLASTGATELGDGAADITTINGSQIILANLTAAGSPEATTLVYDGNSIKSDEIDLKVWDLKLVDYTGTPLNDQIAVFNGSTKTVDGSNTLTFDGSTLNITGDLTASLAISASYFEGDGSRLTGIVADSTPPAGSNTQVQFNNAGAFGASSALTFSANTLTTQGLSVTADTTLGDASGDTVTINAATVTLANVPTSTDNTVLIYDSGNSRIATDEIDSRVWGTSLVDKTGSPNNDYLAVFTDSDTIEGTNALTFISNTLNVGTGTGMVDINGDTLRIRNPDTPASSTASGQEGEIRWDTNYLYICVGTNSWKRIALSTF